MPACSMCGHHSRDSWDACENCGEQFDPEVVRLQLELLGAGILCRMCGHRGFESDKVCRQCGEAFKPQIVVQADRSSSKLWIIMNCAVIGGASPWLGTLLACGLLSSVLGFHFVITWNGGRRIIPRLLGLLILMPLSVLFIRGATASAAYSWGYRQGVRDAGQAVTGMRVEQFVRHVLLSNEPDRSDLWAPGYRQWFGYRTGAQSVLPEPFHKAAQNQKAAKELREGPAERQPRPQ